MDSVNDPATFGGDSSGVVTEDHDGQLAGTVTATGTLTVSDIDSAEAFQASTIGGQHGTLVINTAGEWTYTLDSDFAITGEVRGLIR